MSDTASLRSVRTTATSYVPLENTATSFVQDLQNSPDKDGVMQKIFSNQDTGNILSHVFTNPKTRTDVYEFFEKNSDWCLEQMDQYSDPQFVALGILAKKRPQFVPVILKKINVLLKNKSTPLAVFARVDPEHVNMALVPEIAQYLASEEYNDISLAVVVLARLLQHDRAQMAQQLKAMYKSFDSPEETAVLFKILANLFSIDQILASEIYYDLPEVPAQYWSDKDVVISCLEMLNGCCIVKENRGSIVTNYSILSTAKDSNDKEIKIMASVVYTKLIASGTITENPKALLADLDRYSMLFENYILENVSLDKQAVIQRTNLLFSSLEALAVTSSLSSVRLRCDVPLLQRLATIVRSDDAAWVYGSLSAISNFIEYPFKPTAQEAKAEQIRQKTGALQAFDVDSKLIPDQVMKLVQMFLETSTISYLSNFTGRLSQKSREQVAKILQSTTSQQTGDIRKKAAGQGATIIAVYICIDDKTPVDKKTKAVAASTVSKIIASVDPRNVFTQKFTPVAVIDILKEQINNPDSSRPNLDTFEALMALTNLASIENDQLNTVIVRKCWTRLEDALSTEYMQIQKGIFQLICNLSYCEEAAEKIGAKNDKGDFLRTVLGHALSIDDLDTKLAASGSIAILCNHDDMALLFGHNATVMEQLILNVGSDNDDLLLRVVTALHDIMLISVKRNDDEAIEGVIHFGGVPRLEELIGRVNPNNRALVSIVAKTVKLLVHFKLGKV